MSEDYLDLETWIQAHKSPVEKAGPMSEHLESWTKLSWSKNIFNIVLFISFW